MLLSRHVQYTLVLVLGLACLGCTQGGTDLPTPINAALDDNLFEVSLDVLPPGTYPQTMKRKDGTTVRYALSVPEGYSHAEGAPLIVSLHFGTGRRGRGGPAPPYYGGGMLEMLVQPALRELNAVMIAPDSVGGRTHLCHSLQGRPSSQVAPHRGPR